MSAEPTQWGPILTAVGIGVGIVTSLCGVIFFMLNSNVGKLGVKIDGLYTWAENKFVDNKVCAAKHGTGRHVPVGGDD